MKKAISPQIMVFAILMLVVIAFFTIAVPNFAFINPENLNNILTDAVIPTIFALGMGIVLACSGFDLSLGHIASMTALIVAYLMSGGIKLDPFTAIVIGLGVAAAIGAFSGVVVSRFGISSFIVTLAVQFLIIGVRQIITGGQSVYINNKGYKAMAASPLGISNLVLIMIVVATICYILMQKSTLGRKITFSGANIEAAKFMGIDIKNITLLTFVFAAVLAAFGGVLFAARAGAVQVNSVDSKLLDAITIAVFSGVLFGKYNALGIVLVAILISIIGTGMSMLGIKTEWIDFVKGLILLIAIIMARFINKNKGD